MKNLREFVDSIIKNGGATFNLVTGTSPDTGFVVSESGFEDKIKVVGKLGSVTSELFISAMVEMFIKKNGMELSMVENHLGGWIDDGHLFLDISRVYDSKSVAQRVAKENSQLAFYDIDNGTEIRVV